MVAPDGPVVVTDSGVVRGASRRGWVQFLGIPYAAPPTGDRRWRPPAPPYPWHGIRDATRPGPICPQPPNLTSKPGQIASEDCLHLSILTPEIGDAGRPVMVWVHGGGFVWGTSNDYVPVPLLATGDVVVVTVNYRLGVLGCFAHPELTAEAPTTGSGNYPVLDLVAALDWVQCNIGGFGGDPQRVTLFGQSTGAVLVGACLASPRSAGLFHRVILQGATCAYPVPTLAEEERRGVRFAHTFGAAGTAVADLRGAPASDLVAATGALGFSAWGLVSGDGVLPDPLPRAYAAGRVERVPVMQGTNRHDTRLDAALALFTERRLTTPESYAAAIRHEFRGTDEAILQAYPPQHHPSPALAYAAATTDGLVACPARAMSALLARWTRVYAYEFDDPNAPRTLPIPRRFPLGAYHGAELPYLFDLPTVPAARSAQQQRLARELVGYWTGFAATGEPSGVGLPRWPRYDAESDLVMTLRPGGSRPTTAFASDHRCAFWDPLRWSAPPR